MRIAIISDIHSNIEALETSLRAIEKQRVDEVVCLGDIIGYGANPNECIELVRKTTSHVLLGNHDEAAIDLSRTEYFNPFARIAAEWTNKQLSDENAAYVGELKFILERNGLMFVHSSPYEPEEWHYILSPVDAQFNFAYFTAPICFVGHSHVPGIFCEDIWTLEVVPGKKFIVNVGSIGQPRDNDWRSSFGIFDTEKWTYENIRLEYDVNTAAEKIRKAGLPKALADRLLVGR
ncbi:MAG TPA: metallophosphoesterase family protein [Bacteroidota bacterium]|jgi:predicted phosphodiesterase|nr:metallophosphoesterase family protein [Bacteroidota bacterium]